MRNPKTESDPLTTTTGGLAEGRRVTPVDIQQKEFRLAFRGYSEREVDQFLDELTEEIARLHADNKRLREELEARGTVRMDTGTVNEADEILRRAREQAGRIVAEAETEAARVRESLSGEGAARAPGPAASSPPMAAGVSLVREREFLQNLANLIQSHAAAVRDDLRRVRGSPADEASSGGGGSEPAGTGSGEVPIATRDASPGRATHQDEATDVEGGAGPADDNQPGPPTQAWTPPFVEQTGETRISATQVRPGGPAVAIAEQSDDAPVVIRSDTGLIIVPSVEAMPDEPAQPQGEAEATGETEGNERGLRALFWGED